MARVEYRVAWRRDDDGRLRSKRVRNEAEGLRVARFLVGDFDNPDALACCDGSMCACGGLTVREAWQKYQDERGYEVDPDTGGSVPAPLAAITFGPVIQSREVSAWAAAGEEPTDGD